MPVTIPTRGPADLGPALSNTRAPAPNELSAVHVEKIKDHLIDLAEAVNAPELEVPEFSDTAITVTSLDGLIGPLHVKAFGLSGPTDLAVSPSQPASGPGKGVSILGGVGAADENGGPVTIDAGNANGGASVSGNIRIGRDNAAEVLIGREGVGSEITLEGDVDVLGDIVASGTVSAAPTPPTTVSGTTRTLSGSDHGKVLICTHGSGCAVEVPTDSLPLGFVCAIVRRGGAVNITGSGSGTLEINADFDYYLAGANSLGVVTVLDSTTVLLAGDLLPS